MAQFEAGIPETVPLSVVNRQCSSGLQAFANVAASIAAGHYDAGLACGVELMSSKEMGSSAPEVFWPAVRADKLASDCLVPMGMTSENVAARYGVSREEQDELAASSHVKAARAQAEGRFDAEIVAVTIKSETEGEADVVVSKDEGVRGDTTSAKLSKLRAAFKEGGTTTAGNSSQVSDGAAAVLAMKRSLADRLGLKPLGVFRGYAVTGVPPDEMGVGPAVAIPAALRSAGLRTEDIEVFELNEAFASQALYCAKKLNIPLEKVNPNGGAIALGHPLGCTGARQIATLLHELRRRRSTGYGVVSMCIGTGMGAAGVFQAE
jgi:acetyl-CoA acyltransferase 1